MTIRLRRRTGSWLVGLRRRVMAWLDSRHATRTAQVLALTAILLSGWFSVQQYQLQACQANYAERSNISQRARAEAAEVDRQAQDAMFNEIAASPRGAIDAVRRYNTARAEANQQRAVAPIPPPPSTNCG